MNPSHFTTLDPTNELFERLKTTNPPWWQLVKMGVNQGKYYVDVRKDNSLNVYFNGGSLLKVTYARGVIKGKIHTHYLGRSGSRYVDYELASLPEEVELLTQRIAQRHPNTSENGIKAKLITAPEATYIDSEFAHTAVIGQQTDAQDRMQDVTSNIRIDLTKLAQGKIVFVELKRIDDPRLLTDEYEEGTPPILDQLSAYTHFIKTYKQELTQYYQTLFAIKRDLGVLPQALAGLAQIDDYVMADEVELYLTSYATLNPRRLRRIQAIKTILDRHAIIHNL